MSSLWVESERAAPPLRLQESHRFPGVARPHVRASYAEGLRSGETSPVLAMLAQRGISPGQIAAAAKGARDQGVTVGEYLTGNGYVSADTLYCSVAQHLGMPFLGGKLPLRENIDPYATAKHGVAPIVQNSARGARILVAPRGPALERLMSGVYGPENLRAPLAVTTPERLENALRTHAAATIAAEASEALGKVDPSLSVRSGPTSGESWIALVCLVALAAIALNFPLLGGTCLALAFFAAILLRLFSVAMSFGPPPAAGPPLADANLPVYTIIVALYREEAVIAQLLAALEQLDYPHAKLDTKIVVEADDVETIAALGASRGRLPFEIVIAPPGAPRTKPRALNVALPFARGTLTCVFDAEDKPERSQLRRAAEIFARSIANLACLQARLVVDNYRDNWLTRGIMAQTPPAARNDRARWPR
ncbi:MAG: hypothetical protein QOH65_1308 [Methylobacteriaceae bacterium]|jgi:hypothetical protein|nr:hypothetical protein [Methylobacteriaceae bacterium]